MANSIVRVMSYYNQKSIDYRHETWWYMDGIVNSCKTGTTSVIHTWNVADLPHCINNNENVASV